MSNIQIPNLGAAVALSGSELVEIVQAGVSLRTSTQQIANLFSGVVTLSVQNLDGSLTISPTFGNVIASINTANPNFWSGQQTFVAPALGTPQSGVLTNCVGLPLSTGVVGNLSPAHLDSGLNANAGTFWRGDGVWAAAPPGTVTSVAQTFTGGIISVAGSPITSAGTLALTVAGISGGIPYFSSGTTWASSAALGLNQIMVGGGAGNPPTTILTSANMLAFFTTPSSANLAALMTDETGTAGALVFSVNPAITAPTVTNGTFTAPTINGGTINSPNIAGTVGGGATYTTPTFTAPVLGTPASGNLANTTGYPISQLTGAAVGMLAFLQAATSANLAATVTDETGTGPLVFGNSPVLTNVNITGGTITGVAIGGISLASPVFTGTVAFPDGSTWDVNGPTIAATSLTRFGGSSSAFPALFRSGAELHTKLADNSGFATSRAQNYVAQSGQYYGGNGTSILTPTDGIWRLLNAAGTDFNMLQFGGSTALFPALRRLGGELQVVKSDITDYAPFTAQSYNVARLGAVVLPNEGMFSPAANSLGWATQGTEKLRLTPAGKLGLGIVPDPGWAAAYNAMMIGSSSLFSGNAGSGLVVANNLWHDGVNYRYIAAGGAAIYGLGGNSNHTWYTAPVGAAGASVALAARMTLDGAGLNPAFDNSLDLGTSGNRWRTFNAVTGNFAAAVNITSAGSSGSLTTNTYSRRYWMQIGSMVHGSNYDVIRLPGNPAPGNTRVNLRVHVWLQNLQPNYSYMYREDMWIVCDTGGSNNTAQYSITAPISFSVNSGVISVGFSYDFLRSSGLQYIRLWPTCTGANSAGGLMSAYIEVTLSGDGAPGAT